MKITQEVRDYATQQGMGVDKAVAQGMQEKAVEFTQSGGEIYKKA
jgi:phosphomethylpyrimidine synthase